MRTGCGGVGGPVLLTTAFHSSVKLLCTLWICIKVQCTYHVAWEGGKIKATIQCAVCTVATTAPGLDLSASQ